MADLTGSTIASSYDQLLALPSGGGDGSTLVALTDGNAGNTFALQVSTAGVKSTGTLNVAGITTMSGDLRLEDDAGGEYFGIGTPATVTTYTLTVPAAVGGSGQALRTSDGSGTLEWYTPETGDITGVTAGTGLSGGGTSGTVTLNVEASQTQITALGTIGTGVWQGTAVDGTYIDLEGTEVKSSGPEAITKYLRADGDGTCSWQTVSASVVAMGASITSGTSGSVLFVDSSGNLAQDNDKLFFDATNFRLGIGTDSPDKDLDVNGDAVFGSGATKLNTYSDAGYSGIHNGSTLTSDESVYFGAGKTFFVADGAERMRLTADGLGIGGSPTTKLDVLLGDDGTVKYKSAAETLFEFWKEGSTEEARMNLKSSGTTKVHLRANGDSYFNGGNVGIGTTAPGTYTSVQSNLEVKTSGHGGIAINAGTDSLGMLAFAQNGTHRWSVEMENTATPSLSFNEAGTTRVTFDNGGNVGIGTASPSSKLEISGSSTLAKFTGTGTTTYLKITDSTSAGGNFIGATGDTLHFWTDNVKAVTIDGSQQVGIGTASPNGPLEILKGGAGHVDHLFLTNNNGSDNDSAGIVFSQAPATHSYAGIRGIFTDVSAATEDAELAFYTSEAGTYAEKIRISAAGAFGIAGANYGTSGQVLTSGGSGAAPSWEDASGGSSGVTALSETATVTIDFSSTKLQTLTVTGTCDTLATSNRSAGKEVVLRIYNNAGDYGYFAPTTPNSSADWKEIDQSISSTGVLDGAYGILKLTSWGTADTDVTAELLISP